MKGLASESGGVRRNSFVLATTSTSATTSVAEPSAFLAPPALVNSPSSLVQIAVQLILFQ